jgi:hypothetical protein
MTVSANDQVAAAKRNDGGDIKQAGQTIAKTSMRHTQAQSRRNDSDESGRRWAAVVPSGRTLTSADTNNAGRSTRVGLSTLAYPNRQEL